MHAAITGASSGIGAALARELSRAGYATTLVARRRDLLEKLAQEIGGKTHFIEHDLGDLAKAAEWIPRAEEALGPIDVLVNNAGVQIIGSLVDLPIERVEAMLSLNLLTP